MAGVSLTVYKDMAILFMIINGREYGKTVRADITGAGKDEAELILIDAALACFHHPADITIYTGSAYVYGVLKNRWLDRWEESGWVNSKGNPVRYQTLWQQVQERLKMHQYDAEMKGR